MEGSQGMGQAVVERMFCFCQSYHRQKDYRKHHFALWWVGKLMAVLLWGVNTHTHTHKIHAKMADDVKPRLESAFNKLLSITAKSGNLRKDLKQDIVDS